MVGRLRSSLKRPDMVPLGSGLKNVCYRILASGYMCARMGVGESAHDLAQVREPKELCASLDLDDDVADSARAVVHRMVRDAEPRAGGMGIGDVGGRRCGSAEQNECGGRGQCRGRALDIHGNSQVVER